MKLVVMSLQCQRKKQIITYHNVEFVFYNEEFSSKFYIFAFD